MIWYLATTLSMALLGLIAFLYFQQKGQFDDCEEAKYLPLRDDETVQKQSDE